MGGHVTFVERKQGEINNVFYHTGILNIVKDLDYLNNQLLLNHYFSKLELKNTTHFYPDGYGIMVVDFDTKWIGHRQNYIDPLLFNEASVLLSYLNYSEKNGGNGYFYFFKKALENGCISKMSYFDYQNKKMIQEKLQDKGLYCFEQVYDWLSQKDANEPSVNFEFTPPGWLIQSFDNSIEGSIKLAKILIDKEFDITPSIKNWKNYLDYLIDGVSNQQDIRDKIDCFDQEIILHMRNRMDLKIEKSNKSSLIKKL